MKYTLTKRIPSKIRTVELQWVSEWKSVTQRYLDIRNGLRGRRKGTMTKCDWCNRPFAVGDKMFLASPKPKQWGPKRNWVLCGLCEIEVKDES